MGREPKFNAVAAATSLFIGLTAMPNVCMAGGLSFTPESFKVPITRIYLSGNSGSATLFECGAVKAWNEEYWRPDSQGGGTFLIDPPVDPEFYSSCVLDLLDDKDLEAKFGNRVAEVNSGSYSTLYVSKCLLDGNSDFFIIKGKVSIDGRTWYTQAGPDPFTTNTQNYGGAVVQRTDDGTPWGGGGCLRRSKLTNVLEVAGNGESRANLFMVPQNMALANTAPVNGAYCTKVGSKSGLALCVSSSVDMFLSTTDDEVLLESYLFSPDTTDFTGASAVGEMDLLLSKGVLFGATSKVFIGPNTSNPYFPGLPWNMFTFPIMLFENNTSNDYTIIWSSFDDADPRDGYMMKMPGFVRTEHAGEVSLSDGVVPYRAVRLR